MIGKEPLSSHFNQLLAPEYWSLILIFDSDFLIFNFSRTSLDNSKRWGTLALVNQLFKIYFRVSVKFYCILLFTCIVVNICFDLFCSLGISFSASVKIVFFLEDYTHVPIHQPFSVIQSLPLYPLPLDPLFLTLSPPQINKLHLCKPLIRAIDSSDIKDRFSLAQLVTYRWGRIVRTSHCVGIDIGLSSSLPPLSSFLPSPPLLPLSSPSPFPLSFLPSLFLSFSPLPFFLPPLLPPLLPLPSSLYPSPSSLSPLPLLSLFYLFHTIFFSMLPTSDTRDYTTYSYLYTHTFTHTGTLSGRRPCLTVTLS